MHIFKLSESSAPDTAGDRIIKERLLEDVAPTSNPRGFFCCMHGCLSRCDGLCVGTLSVFKENDNGVPPGCRQIKFCPLHHKNPCFNDNRFARSIGQFGYPFFDKHRGFFMGIASYVALITFLVTAYGCFALSTNEAIVQRTYWAGASIHNVSSGEYFAGYVGLRSAVFVNCKIRFRRYPSACEKTVVDWTSSECTAGLAGKACEACKSSATSLWITAFNSCFSLLLSFLGAQTRMRTIADVPIQKMLGMGAELWGAFSLAVALYIFHSRCWNHLHSSFNTGDLVSRTWSGPGFIAYGICVASGAIRGLLHWVTPLPEMGKGCCACGKRRGVDQLPPERASQVDKADEVSEAGNVIVEVLEIGERRRAEKEEGAGVDGEQKGRVSQTDGQQQTRVRSRSADAGEENKLKVKHPEILV